MEKISLGIFGMSRSGVLLYTDKIQNFLEEKGAEYAGPVSPPAFTSEIPIDEINSVAIEDWATTVPKWLEEIDPSETSCNRLQSFANPDESGPFTLFFRGFTLKNPMIVQEVTELELPPGACLHVTTDTVDQYTGGKGTPYTYDPGRDHVTDMD